MKKVTRSACNSHHKRTGGKRRKNLQRSSTEGERKRTKMTTERKSKERDNWGMGGGKLGHFNGSYLLGGTHALSHIASSNARQPIFSSPPTTAMATFDSHVFVGFESFVGGCPAFFFFSLGPSFRLFFFFYSFYSSTSKILILLL